MLSKYFKRLYQRTMEEAYEKAYRGICECIGEDSKVLDCGAGNGGTFKTLSERCGLSANQYQGIEWNPEDAFSGQAKGINIICYDLNEKIQLEDESCSCVYALSVLEHLLNPCRFIIESQRILKPGGRLVLLTPNISTYFTALLILLGRMPSSGPHPDSDLLIKSQEVFKVSNEELQPDSESTRPHHRHIVVFSFRALRKYLQMAGFSNVKGYGFGLYPFPEFLQPFLEHFDPYHCHQMVFIAEKRKSKTKKCR